MSAMSAAEFNGFKNFTKEECEAMDKPKLIDRFLGWKGSVQDAIQLIRLFEQLYEEYRQIFEDTGFPLPLDGSDSAPVPEADTPGKKQKVQWPRMTVEFDRIKYFTRKECEAMDKPKLIDRFLGWQGSARQAMEIIPRQIQLIEQCQEILKRLDSPMPSDGAEPAPGKGALT